MMSADVWILFDTHPDNDEQRIISVHATEGGATEALCACINKDRTRPAMDYNIEHWKVSE